MRSDQASAGLVVIQTCAAGKRDWMSDVTMESVELGDARRQKLEMDVRAMAEVRYSSLPLLAHRAERLWTDGAWCWR